jgi:hypothetical protein
MEMEWTLDGWEGAEKDCDVMVSLSSFGQVALVILILFALLLLTDE